LSNFEDAGADYNLNFLSQRKSLTHLTVLGIRYV